jgi:hypothetical protein
VSVFVGDLPKEFGGPMAVVERKPGVMVEINGFTERCAANFSGRPFELERRAVDEAA